MQRLRPTADDLWTRIGAPSAGTARPVAADELLAKAGTPIEHVFFPIDTAILIARQTPLDRVPLTVALVGREGLVGNGVLLDSPIWRHDAIALMPGTVIALPAEALLEHCAAVPTVQRLLLRVVHNYQLQLAQSVVANLGHSVERRVARWLAMLDDRSGAAMLAITHEQLAQLLNVRRATVTDTLHVLEGEGLIKNTRGRVIVRDRDRLEARAGQSYGFSEGDYAANIGPFGLLPSAE